MSRHLFKQSVAFPEALIVSLDAMSVKTGLNRSELIRNAVHQYLDFHAGRGANPTRVAELAEFCQLALDIIISDKHPDKREMILQNVRHRLITHHGK